MIRENKWQSSKTHCPRGHACTPENTKLAKSTKPGKFKRQCRKCKSESAASARIRDKLAKLAALGDPGAAFPAIEDCGAPAIATVPATSNQPDQAAPPPTISLALAGHPVRTTGPPVP